MDTAIISPKAHGLIDYALTGALLTLPSVLGFSKTVRKIYAAEALILLGYVACTDQPAAISPLIPFKTHGKIDPFNVGQFALQTFLKPFREDKKARAFNVGFTLVAGALVAFTDWNGRTKKKLRVF